MRTVHAATALAVLALIAAGVAAPASAHHSFAMYDLERLVTLKGAVKTFRWSNPHAIVEVTGSIDGGPVDTWTVEMTSPGNLVRLGWTRATLQPGDKVSIRMAPLRNGQHGGGFRGITLADGRTLQGSVGDLSPPRMQLEGTINRS